MAKFEEEDPPTDIGVCESSAIACLKAISTGQEMFKNAVAVDVNRNGVGEYGFLAELGGSASCRGGGPQYSANPFIPTVLGTVDKSGISVKRGYCFIVYLPTGRGRTTSNNPKDVQAETAESAYITYAWPLKKGTTGNREFLIDPQGFPFFRKAVHSGKKDPPGWNEGFSPEHGKNWAAGIDDKVWKPIE